VLRFPFIFRIQNTATFERIFETTCQKRRKSYQSFFTEFILSVTVSVFTLHHLEPGLYSDGRRGLRGLNPRKVYTVKHCTIQCACIRLYVRMDKYNHCELRQPTCNVVLNCCCNLLTLVKHSALLSQLL